MPETAESRGARAGKLFQEHYAKLVSFLCRITGERPQAEEIAAEVFCKLALREGAVESDAAWIYCVAANAGLDAVRSKSRRRELDTDLRQRAVRQRTALDELLREEQRVRVRTVLAAMKPRDAQLLLLRAEDMSYKDIADLMDVAKGSVGTMLVRAEAEFEKKYRAMEGKR